VRHHLLIGFRAMRVLIVDDDAGVVRLLRTLLARDGHEVSQAHDGSGGLAELAGAAVVPDLLILDRMLPDMDGAELLARLRSDARTARLPVLMLTAAARASAWVDDGKLTRILAKPFDLADFRAVLAELTSGSPAQ
jgi:DNA-binding response OmpR family regulator